MGLSVCSKWQHWLLRVFFLSETWVVNCQNRESIYIVLEVKTNITEQVKQFQDGRKDVTNIERSSHLTTSRTGANVEKGCEIDLQQISKHEILC